MKSTALCMARFAAAAWVGAAVLFVIVSVREVTTAAFTSDVKDRLAVLRFPLYYGCGAVMIGLALVGAVAALGHSELCRRRGLVAITLLFVASVEMAADYQFIYRPLEALVTPPGKARTSEFVALHKWSTRMNTVNVALVATAATLLCWPNRQCAIETSREGELRSV